MVSARRTYLDSTRPGGLGLVASASRVACQAESPGRGRCGGRPRRAGQPRPPRSGASSVVSASYPATPTRPSAAAGQVTTALAWLPARLRFPGSTAATWRAGQLIAADGRVRWLSRKGDAEVDLTAACQAPVMLSAGAESRQPRTTALASASGLVEVDVSPRALAALARNLDHSPYGETAHPTAQD